MKYLNTKFYEASKISGQDILTFVSGSSWEVVQGKTRMQSLEEFEVCSDEPETQFKVIWISYLSRNDVKNNQPLITKATF